MVVLTVGNAYLLVLADQSLVTSLQAQVATSKISLDQAIANHRKAIAIDIQREAFASVPYVPLGKYVTNTALRRNLSGLIKAPATLMWNIEKT